MAFSQVDPARLDGDALTRWYLRSPADIEAERRQVAEQAYNTFFGQSEDAQTNAEPVGQGDDPASADGPTANQVEVNRGLSDASGGAGDSYQVAAASSPGFWDYWSPHGCASCHGYTPGILPPVGGRSPLPPTYSPRTGGDGSGGTSSNGEWSDKPQCNQQFANDRTICQRAKDYRCWENQNERLRSCNRTGLIGQPPLGFGPRGR